MYNRYIGNTGKFTRVDDRPGGRPSESRAQARGSPPPPVHQPSPVPPPLRAEPPHPEAPRAAAKSKSLLGNLGGGLSSLLGGFGSKNGGGSLLGGFGNGLKGLGGMFDHLPFGLDIGDILLLMILFFFFLESGDEEFLIILGVIAFSLYKDR